MADRNDGGTSGDSLAGGMSDSESSQSGRGGYGGSDGFSATNAGGGMGGAGGMGQNPGDDASLGMDADESPDAPAGDEPPPPPADPSKGGGDGAMDPDAG